MLAMLMNNRIAQGIAAVLGFLLFMKVRDETLEHKTRQEERRKFAERQAQAQARAVETQAEVVMEERDVADSALEAGRTSIPRFSASMRDGTYRLVFGRNRADQADGSTDEV